MNKGKSFSPDDPDPTTPEGIREQIDYWTKEIARGQKMSAGSQYAARVQGRLDHLRDLEKRFQE